MDYYSSRTSHSRRVFCDLVIWDISLPGISGLDVAKQVRRDPALARNGISDENAPHRQLEVGQFREWDTERGKDYHCQKFGDFLEFAMRYTNPVKALQEVLAQNKKKTWLNLARGFLEHA